MTRVDVDEAKSRLDELLSAAARGETVEIGAADGRVYRLVPVDASLKSKRGLVGSHQGGIWMADDFDETLKDFKAYLGED